MTPISLPHIELLLVEVPEGAKGFYVDENELQFVFNGTLNGRGLPSGNYELIGLASLIEEDVAKGLVDTWIMMKYKCYRDFREHHLVVPTAKESIETLVRSLSLQPDTTVILKQVK